MSIEFYPKHQGLLVADFLNPRGRVRRLPRTFHRVQGWITDVSALRRVESHALIVVRILTVQGFVGSAHFLLPYGCCTTRPQGRCKIVQPNHGLSHATQRDRSTIHKERCAWVSLGAAQSPID